MSQLRVSHTDTSATVWLQLLRHCKRFSECQPLIFDSMGQQLVQQQQELAVLKQQLAVLQQQQLAKLQEQLAVTRAQAAAEAGELLRRSPLAASTTGTGPKDDAHHAGLWLVPAVANRQ